MRPKHTPERLSQLFGAEPSGFLMIPFAPPLLPGSLISARGFCFDIPSTITPHWSFIIVIQRQRTLGRIFRRTRLASFRACTSYTCPTNGLTKHISSVITYAHNMTTRHACANMPFSYRGEHVLHRGVRTARKVWELAWHAAAAPNARRKRPNSCAHSHAQPDNPTRTTHTQAHAPCAATGSEFGARFVFGAAPFAIEVSTELE